MAHTKRTIVGRMVEQSGKTAEEISALIDREANYVSRVISGDLKDPTVNTLALIAEKCGYELAFVGHNETLVLATYQPPIEDREVEITETYDCEFTGTEIAVTGSLYGLTSEAQEALCKSLGATWVEKVRTRSTDFLITGTDYDPENPFGQVKRVLNAKRTNTQLMSAEDFRKRCLHITGIDISAR